MCPAVAGRASSLPHFAVGPIPRYANAHGREGLRWALPRTDDQGLPQRPPPLRLRGRRRSIACATTPALERMGQARGAVWSAEANFGGPVALPRQPRKHGAAHTSPSPQAPRVHSDTNTP